MQRSSLVRFLIAAQAVLLGYSGIQLSALWRSSKLPTETVEAGTGSVQGVATVGEPVTLEPYPSLPVPAYDLANAKEYVLYHQESGKLLLHSEFIDSVPIASTTKLMTAYVTLKYARPEELVTVPQEVWEITGSLAGLQVGKQIAVLDALKALLLPSGNDAAHTLSVLIGGRLADSNPAASEAERTAAFVAEMNREAAALGMSDTRYMDPAGLNDDGRSTAFDLAKLTSVVNQNSILSSIMRTPIATIVSTDGGMSIEVRNSNQHVTDIQYPGTLGGKTGFTYDAGHCLVTSAQQNGQTLIAVILHTDEDSAQASAKEAKKLLDYGFRYLTWQ